MSDSDQLLSLLFLIFCWLAPGRVLLMFNLWRIEQEMDVCHRSFIVRSSFDVRRSLSTKRIVLVDFTT